MDEDVAAVAGEVEEGLRGGAVEVGVGGVGADAEDDGVEVGEPGGGEVGYGDHRRGEADGGEGFGDGVAGAGEVGDADVLGELEVDRDYAGGRGGVVVGEDEAGIAYGAEAFGVGVVVGVWAVTWKSCGPVMGAVGWRKKFTALGPAALASMDQLCGDWTLMLAEVVASVRRVARSCAVVWPLGRTVAVGALAMETGGMMEMGCGPSCTMRPTSTLTLA